MMRFDIPFSFQGIHSLPASRDKRSVNHGHSFQAIASMETDCKTEDEVCINASDSVLEAINRIVKEYLDFKHINNTTNIANPTSGALAEWIFNRLVPPIRMIHGLELVSVTVYETCTCSCTYYPSKSTANNKDGLNKASHPVLDYLGEKSNPPKYAAGKRRL